MSISIAIDGPSGAGKSTLAKSVSKELDYLYVDTGAIYRTIGYAALVNKRDPKDAAAVAAMLPDLEIGLCYGADGLQHMTLNGKDVTEQIRLPETSLYASAVSAHPAVRAHLLEMQRKLVRENNVVMDGRDIGTVVLPDATVKIFITASLEERARLSPLKRCWRKCVSGIITILTGLPHRCGRRRTQFYWIQRSWISGRAVRHCSKSSGRGPRDEECQGD